MTAGTTTNNDNLRRARIDDEPWDAAVARAESEGHKMPDVLRHLVTAYAAGDIDIRVKVVRRRATHP